MKKTVKKLLAGISALTIMTTGTISVSAEQTYDLNNEDYISYINEHCGKRIEKDELMIEIFTNIGRGIVENEELKYFYKNGNFNAEGTTYMAETELDNKVRIFAPLWNICWNRFENFENKNLCEEYSASEINDFLNSNNFKAQVKEMIVVDEELYPGSVDSFCLSYNEDITENEVIDIAYALYKEYNVAPYLSINDLLGGFFYIETNEISPTANYDTITIAGDLDNDSTPGLTDVVKLTKYNANSELYPLADATALANADVNQDGTIDALDTNLLIEMVLGSYESAV